MSKSITVTHDRVHTNSLRDGHCGTETYQLNCNEQQYPRLAHSTERIVCGGERLVSEKVEDFARNPIAL